MRRVRREKLREREEGRAHDQERECSKERRKN